MLSKEECQGGMVPPCTDIDSMQLVTMALFGSRARVQKGDCVYSIVHSIVHTSAELAHSILDLHCAQSILPYRQHIFVAFCGVFVTFSWSFRAVCVAFLSCFSAVSVVFLRRFRAVFVAFSSCFRGVLWCFVTFSSCFVLFLWYYRDVSAVFVVFLWRFRAFRGVFVAFSGSWRAHNLREFLRFWCLARPLL